MAKYSPIRRVHQWVRGETKTFVYVVYENAGTEDVPDWQPADITGWTLRWFLVENGSGKGSTKLIERTTANGEGIEITHPLVGRAAVTIPAAASGELAARQYWKELWRTNSGYEQRLAYGEAELCESAS